MLKCAGCFYRYMAIRITFIKIYSTLQKLVQLLTQALMGATRPAFFQQPRPAFIGNKSKGSQTGVFLALPVSLNLVYEHCIFPDARDASPPLEIGIPLTHYFILHRPTLWWCRIIGRDFCRNRQHSHWAWRGGSLCHCRHLWLWGLRGGGIRPVSGGARSVSFSL